MFIYFIHRFSITNIYFISILGFTCGDEKQVLFSAFFIATNGHLHHPHSDEWHHHCQDDGHHLDPTDNENKEKGPRDVDDLSLGPWYFYFFQSFCTAI
jgi:hypothetical protein